MKFNWGTGIFLFLALFLAASAVFIIFASRQQVNLVHKDYYEKGVDYSDQMKVDTRSKPFLHALKTTIDNQNFVVTLEKELATKIDSGQVLLFRPSDKTKDVFAELAPRSTQIIIDKNELINGRYILKMSWYSEGLRYEIQRPVNVQ